MYTLAVTSFTAAMTTLAIVAMLAMMTIGASFLVALKRSRSVAASLKATLVPGGDPDRAPSSEAVLAAIRTTPMSVLASDRDLRHNIYSALRTSSVPRRTSSVNGAPGHSTGAAAITADDLSENGYIAIDRTLAEVPQTIPEEEDNPPQKVSLDVLAQTLADMQEPFRSWSKRFKNASETLASVLPMEKKLRALLGAALKAKAHFDIDFYEAVVDVRERAQDRDEYACSKAIDNMVESVVSWVRLTSDWYSLRQDAAGRMHRADTGVSEWSGQLRHLAVKFGEPGTRTPMVWWQSSLLSRSDSLDRLSTWIFREIDDRIRDKRWSTTDFSAVCSMSSTGVPLATLLSSHYGKRFLAVDEGANYRFPPGFQPEPGDNVLLVDSNISTGMHVLKCAKEITEAGAFVMGVVVICENDMCEDQRLPIVETLRRDDRLIRLFTLSDIYSRWRQEQVLTE